MSTTNGNSTYYSDVCVIGGGPTGFITAINLAQAGMKVTVFEANPNFSLAFRAIGHTPAVLPMFTKVGILERAKAVATEFNGSICFRRTTDKTIIEEIHAAPGRPGPMVLPQSKLTKIMVERFAELDGTELLMGHKVSDFQDNGKDGITVDVLDTETNETKTYKCKYLVGADGSRSFTRKHLGLGYKGKTLPFKLVAADLFYPFEKYGWDGANFMVDAEMFGNIALVDYVNGESLWRIGIGFPLDMPDEDIIKALPARYRAMFPHEEGTPFTYRHLTDPTPYIAHHFCAPRLKSGNVFLVGDAAHIANPFSGQVLACGIFDASALADCIVAVEQERKPESLLEDWSKDRVAKYKTVLDPLARACFEAVSHPDIENVATRHPFLKAVRAGTGPPPSLATKIETLPSWTAVAVA